MFLGFVMIAILRFIVNCVGTGPVHRVVVSPDGAMVLLWSVKIMHVSCNGEDQERKTHC